MNNTIHCGMFYGNMPQHKKSICGLQGCKGHKACRQCKNIYARRTRTRHREMTPEERQRANCRSYANVYQRRGRLKPQPCVICGSEPVEKHHVDYGRPLLVIWACRDCHERLDALRGDNWQAVLSELAA